MAKKEEKPKDEPGKPQHAPDNWHMAIDGPGIPIRATDSMTLSDGTEVGPGDSFEASKQYAHDLVRHGRAVFDNDEMEDVEEKDDQTGEIRTIKRKKPRGK